MQKAYQALRVISEAQTVHIVLASDPGTLMLTELMNTCEGLHAGSDDGIKAVILDFVDQADAQMDAQAISSDLLAKTRAALQAVPQPVLAVVRANLSKAASQLVEEGDFTLMAHQASFVLPIKGGEVDQEEQRIHGLTAERLGKVTWATSAGDLNRKMESVLDMLRTKSAAALRSAKTGVRLGQQTSVPTLEILDQVHQFYLENAVQTEDAREGTLAFLQKRQPLWKNR